MNRNTMRLMFLGIVATAVTVAAQEMGNVAAIDVGKAKYKISRNIYGHFSEHLGHCIYGGFWVGEDSRIANVRGIRSDVVAALKAINAPVLRWPGGCFADEYHWQDGIGPRAARTTMINTNWGGVTEDNSFGTHEFLDLCEQIGCAPYITGNLGSGTVHEMSQWVEYVNSDKFSPMTDLRKQNGREKSWGVPFWGLGNEAWGCGGNMKPEYYADLARQVSSFLKNYGDNRLKKIVVGPAGDDYNWTEVIMREMGNSIWGLSLHYYTWCSDENATAVTEESWYNTLIKTLKMEELVTKHAAIMDKYDPGKSVVLVVDEWGTWYAVEPGTNPGFLFQQNTLRDALVAGINLNIFNNHCNRVKMAAIAQAVNVLQAVILTQEDKMVLTPTYHVFDLYQVHQDAVMIPVTLQTDSITFKNSSLPALSMSASLAKNGKLHLTICNLNTSQDEKLTCNLASFNVQSAIGRILTAATLDAHNTFENPNQITIQPFNGFSHSSHRVEILLPRHSVVAIELAGVLEIAEAKVDLKSLQPGLTYNYYEGSWQRLPDFSELPSLRSGSTRNFSYPAGTATLNFGLVFTGYLKIGVDGIYEFFLTSDDGSKLTIDGEEVIVNDGLHALIEVAGSVFLTKGYHAIEVAFFQASGGSGLQLKMQQPGQDKAPLDDTLLYHLTKE